MFERKVPGTEEQKIETAGALRIFEASNGRKGGTRMECLPAGNGWPLHLRINGQAANA